MMNPSLTPMVDAVLPTNIPVKIPQTWLTVLLLGHVILQSPGQEARHI